MGVDPKEEEEDDNDYDDVDNTSVWFCTHLMVTEGSDVRSLLFILAKSEIRGPLGLVNPRRVKMSAVKWEFRRFVLTFDFAPLGS